MSPGSGRSLKAKSKVWLEVGGKPAFGDGKLTWLETIRRSGSLRAAAEELGMSYRGLWGRLREMEKRLGLPLLHRRAGGRGGGGAALTEEALDLMRKYRRFRRGINEMVDTRFEKAFARRGR